MKRKTILAILSTAVLASCMFQLRAQDCIDYSTMTSTPATYNNNALYPAGSLIASSGPLFIIKTYPGGWQMPGTDLSFVTDSMFTYDGYMTYDVSYASSPCRELSIEVEFGPITIIVVDGDTVALNGNIPAYYQFNGFEFTSSTTVSGGYDFFVKGFFDEMQIAGANVMVTEACYHACDSCQTSFSYQTSGNTIDFTNTSSVDSSDADLIYWNFGDGNTSSDYDPTHTYSSPGTYYICLSIVDSDCILNPTMQYCHSVTVGSAGGGAGNGCVDFDDLTDIPTNYNNNTLYPVGTALMSAGALDVIKTYPGGWQTPGTQISFVTDSSFIYDGYMSFNVSSAANLCRELSVKTGVSAIVSIVIDGDTVALNGNIPPYYQFNGFEFTSTLTGSGGYEFFIDGTFDELQISGSNIMITEACYSACDSCSTSFTYQNLGLNTVDFMNTSSVDSSDADLIYWDFGDGNFSSDYDPSHTYASPGTYYVCLSIVDSDCILNPTMQYCDSVTVGSSGGGGNGCINFNDLTDTPTNYNNNTLYPVGSALVSAGALNVIKTHVGGWQVPGTDLSFVTDSSFIYDGYMSFDVSNAAIWCRELSLTVEFGYIFDVIIDGDTITSGGTIPANYQFNGFEFTSVVTSSGGYEFFVDGAFDEVQISGANIMITEACYQACDSCQTSYTYQIGSGATVDFTNTSTADSSATVQVWWDFGDGTTSYNNDPVHTFANPGTYYVCIYVVNPDCPYLQTQVYCDSVTVLGSGNCNNQNMILTPNDDGVDDQVLLSAGSRIYNRTGFLVREIEENMNWTGLDQNNRELPMGFYTVICSGNESFKVTIVR